MAMFKNAKTLQTPTRAKKGEKPTEPMKGIRVVAILDGLIKALGSLKETFDGEVKASALDMFVKAGSESHKRPENFKASEGDATASIEMRKRSTASALNDGEAEMLDNESIPYDTLTVAPKLYAINPKYAGDEVLMKRIETALTKALKGTDIPADDLFVVQEEVTKRVVSEKTLDAVFSAETVSSDIVSICTVLAIKPKVENFNVVAALKEIKDLLK